MFVPPPRSCRRNTAGPVAGRDRSALLDAFASLPDAVIEALRSLAIARGMPWGDLFALAELSYFRGRQTASKPHLLDGRGPARILLGQMARPAAAAALGTTVALTH